MSHGNHGAPTRRALAWLLVCIGVTSLAWCLAVWRRAEIHQGQSRVVVTRAAADGVAPFQRGQTGAPLGMLTIPRLAVASAVAEGDDATTLAVAIGHLPDTPLPWEDGNSAVAGHRDTFFRPLKDIRVGDEVELATAGHGVLRYRVRETRVVLPTDLSVLAPTDRPMLTLITCYPFRYIGPAPLRFVTVAERLGGEESRGGRT